MTDARIARPRVSVIMTAKNEEDLIESAIRSVLDQSFRDFELIVIDDGSTDETPHLLFGLAKAEPRLVWHRCALSIGRVPALNRALSVARGEFIAVMDADDLCLADRLRLQVDHLDAHPEIGFVGCGHDIIDRDGTPLTANRTGISADLLNWMAPFTPPLIHPTGMIRKTVLTSNSIRYRLPEERRASVQDPDPRAGTHGVAEDFDLWQRLASVTDGDVIEGCHFLYRKPVDATSAPRPARRLANTLDIMDIALAKRYTDVLEVQRRTLISVLRDDISLSPGQVSEASRTLRHMRETWIKRRQPSAADQQASARLCARWLMRSLTQRTKTEMVAGTVAMVGSDFGLTVPMVSEVIDTGSRRMKAALSRHE
ncbi:MAG: glycosyltransferase family A protein [Pseudomonadota bacterium]